MSQADRQFWSLVDKLERDGLLMQPIGLIRLIFDAGRQSAQPATATKTVRRRKPRKPQRME